MPSIAVIHTDSSETLVQADPPFCVFAAAAPMGAHVPGESDSLVVNANYFFEGFPLGVMVDRGRVLPFTPIPDKRRTALVIADGGVRLTEPLSSAEVTAALAGGEWDNATVIQAGPRLVRDGAVVEAASAIDEEFLADALRRTKQVGIGITAVGKLLVLYAENRSAQELGQRLAAHGAVQGFKVDGGHAAFLRFGSIARGAPRPFTALVVTPQT
jgi:hypothetical protein